MGLELFVSWFAWMGIPGAWLSLVMLTALLIILGVDNILFISILASKLPKKQRSFARRLGVMVALGARLVLLGGIAWVMQLQTTLFEVMAHAFTGKDLVLLAGGLFLLGKSTKEIHANLEGDGGHKEAAVSTLSGVIIQVLLLDAVFSVDSVITGIGMTEHISLIVVAMFIAMGVMIASVNFIGQFIQRHPSFKILALSFLLLIGTMLITESMGYHVPKGYIYFAMAFSVFVETIEINAEKESKEPAKLRNTPSADEVQ